MSSHEETGCEALRRTKAALDAYSSCPSSSHPQRPFVTLTYATSLDGCIAATKGQPLLLSGIKSMKMTHALRAMHQAICCGIGTMISDNPSLTVRLVDGDSPTPVLIDSRLRCPIDAKIMAREPILCCVSLNDTGVKGCVTPMTPGTSLESSATGATADDRSEPYFASERAAYLERKKALEAAGARILECKGDYRRDDGGNITALAVNLADMLHKLYAVCNIQSLMVEGGSEIITSFVSTCVGINTRPSQKQQQHSQQQDEKLNLHDDEAPAAGTEKSRDTRQVSESLTSQPGLDISSGGTITTRTASKHTTSSCLVDQCIITIAPLLIGGLNSIGSLLTSDNARLPRLANTVFETIGTDVVVSGEFVSYRE